ncbi:hypothetical protein LX90_009218 [Lentzea flava]|nr:hypothetical protein [Lentzea flava]
MQVWRTILNFVYCGRLHSNRSKAEAWPECPPNSAHAGRRSGLIERGRAARGSPRLGGVGRPLPPPHHLSPQSPERGPCNPSLRFPCARKWGTSDQPHECGPRCRRGSVHHRSGDCSQRALTQRATASCAAKRARGPRLVRLTISGDPTRHKPGQWRQGRWSCTRNFSVHDHRFRSRILPRNDVIASASPLLPCRDRHRASGWLTFSRSISTSDTASSCRTTDSMLAWRDTARPLSPACPDLSVTTICPELLRACSQPSRTVQCSITQRIACACCEAGERGPGDLMPQGSERREVTS